MLPIERLDRIIVEHDPYDLFDSDGTTTEEFDRDGIVSEYGVSLSFYLAETFNPTSVEVTPVANLPEWRISVEPVPADAATAERVRAAIRAAIDDHDKQGAFWAALE